MPAGAPPRPPPPPLSWPPRPGNGGGATAVSGIAAVRRLLPAPTLPQATTRRSEKWDIFLLIDGTYIDTSLVQLMPGRIVKPSFVYLWQCMLQSVCRIQYIRLSQIRIQGSDDQKLKEITAGKIYSWKNLIFFIFWSKLKFTYVVLQKGLLSCLQLSKQNIRNRDVYPDPGSGVKKIPIPDPRKIFFNPKYNFLSSQNMKTDPDLDFFTHTESRGQKGTGSGSATLRIRNAGCLQLFYHSQTQTHGNVRYSNEKYTVTERRLYCTVFL